MYTPDYDDYYSLRKYAARFISDVDETIDVYFSRPSVLNLVTFWELSNDPDVFRQSQMEIWHSRAMDGEDISLKDLVTTCNLQCVIFDGDDIIAHETVYNDFVAWLTELGINV